jgi:hypothetical protein
MLGRGIGISDEKLRHLGDDPLPEGVYSEAEAAVVRYAQRSTNILAKDIWLAFALELHRQAIFTLGSMRVRSKPHLRCSRKRLARDIRDNSLSGGISTCTNVKLALTKGMSSAPSFAVK